jgi:hypothetical protein
MKNSKDKLLSLKMVPCMMGTSKMEWDKAEGLRFGQMVQNI